MSQSSSAPMTLARIAAGVFALPLTTFALFTLSTALQGAPVSLLFCIPAACAAWFAGMFALSGRLPSNPRIRYAMLGALLLGGVGFAAGFIGPIVFSPSSNQGPLLSLFTTPAGALVGAVLGAIVGHGRARGEGEV